METVETVNKKIACTPFPTISTRVEVKGGLPVIKQKEELTPLTVVFNYTDGGLAFMAGDTVYVRGECCKHQWAREVFELEGKQFVLCPIEFVVAFKRT
jgi:hypothetical protein